MRVSVIVPVYNKAPFLKEAIGSILNGTYADHEIICVDDKSKDNSLDVLRSIQDPRIRIIELPRNLGPAGAANAALDACTGEYVVRLDADDMAVPDRLEKQVAFMDAHPDIGASGGRLELFGDSNESWSFPLSPDDCAAQQLFGVPVSQPASILRRSVLETHGLRYDPDWPRFGEDWLFWIRVGRVTRLANMDSTIAFYRRGEQNSGHGRDRFADYTFLVRSVLTFYGIPFTEEEIDLHLISMYLFKARPTKELIGRLKTWQEKLVAWNASNRVFPAKALSERIDRSWNGLYYYLPRFGTGAAMEHLRLSGSWPADRLTYLAKYRVNALLGRVANG